MTKRNESVLGLAPLAPPTGLSTNGHLAPFSPGRALTKDQRRILEEWHKETLVIDTTAAKTVFGMSKIAEIHQHASIKFDETVDYILAVKEEEHSREHQQYVDEFSTRQIQLLAKHLLGAIEVGGTNIGIEIHRSLYLLSEPEQRSFWQRLLRMPSTA